MVEQQTLDEQRTNRDWDHRQLFEAAQQRAVYLSASQTVAAAVGQSVDLPATLQTVLNVIVNASEAQAAAIYVLDEAAEELVLRVQSVEPDHAALSLPDDVRVAGSIYSSVVCGSQVLTLRGTAVAQLPVLHGEGFQALILVPMHARGQVVGVLSVLRDRPEPFTDDAVAMLRAIADQAGVAIDNARLYDRAHGQSSCLSVVLQAASDGILSVDRFGQVIAVNPMAEQLLSLHAPSVLGLPLAALPLQAGLLEGFDRALNYSQPGSTAFEATLADGRIVALTIVPVFAGELPNGWVIIARVVTYLHRTEQVKVDFVHAAAHDMRNPLGAAQGALMMLDSDLGDISEIHREIIAIGLQSIGRMQEMIDDLLNLESLENGPELQLRPVSLSEVVNQSVTEVASSLQQRGQTVQVDVPDQLPVVHGDQQWPYRALTNLLSNASKYTHSGDEVIVRAHVQAEDLYLEVVDHGPGIPPERQHHVFERFYRAPETKHEVKGTGLGLSIVKSVVEQHGGRVFVQSEVGCGSVFGMVLPLAVQAE